MSGGGFTFTEIAVGVVPWGVDKVTHEGPLTNALKVIGAPVLSTEMNWLCGVVVPESQVKLRLDGLAVSCVALVTLRVTGIWLDGLVLPARYMLTKP